MCPFVTAGFHCGYTGGNGGKFQASDEWCVSAQLEGLAATDSHGGLGWHLAHVQPQRHGLAADANSKGGGVEE